MSITWHGGNARPGINWHTRPVPAALRAAVAMDWAGYVRTREQVAAGKVITPAAMIYDLFSEKYAELGRIKRALTGEGVLRERGEASSDAAEMDAARQQLLAKLQTDLSGAVTAGQEWPAALVGRHPAEVLYAALRLFAGRAEYASWAENETANFLQTLALANGRTFYDITAHSAKRTNERGPDGIFVGATEIFGLAAPYAGLEVKTVVSFSSLRSALNGPRKTWVEDHHVFRQNSLTYGKARLAKVPTDEAKQLLRNLATVTPDQFATMLVVRECGLESVIPDPWVYEAFDIVLIFDVYNRINWRTSRGIGAPKQPMIDRVNAEFLINRAKGYLLERGLDVRAVNW